MTEEEQQLMEQYGITVEQKYVYTYGNYKYEHLEEAVNYARAQVNFEPESGTPSTAQ